LCVIRFEPCSPSEHQLSAIFCNFLTFVRPVPYSGRTGLPVENRQDSAGYCPIWLCKCLSSSLLVVEANRTFLITGHYLNTGASRAWSQCTLAIKFVLYYTY
ncbi:unnamed protein product, partial [Nesidiocoris tenuis]